MNFRRHGKIWVIGLFLSLMPYACYDELDLPPSLKEGGGRELFCVGEARRYFETHARDLALPYFSAQKPETKSVEGETPELVPEWSKALQDSNRLVSLVQVPIRSNAKVTAIVRNYENGRQVAEKYAHSEMRLVVARQPDSVTVMFVATLIPSLQHCPNPAESMKNFSFLGGGDFTGQAFCFTLDGRFVEAWEYVNGKRIGPYEVATIKQFMRNNISLENKNYESVSLGHSMPTRLGAYSLDECSAEAGCVCEEHENCLCPYCLDEAIARVCPYCRASLEPGEECDCKSKCVWCGYNPCKCCSVCLKYPCKCNYTICQYCLLSPCQCLSDCPICRPGLCSKCKDCGNHYCWEDHDGTGGSGGSSGGSVGLDNPFLPDTAVVNMNNFVDRIFNATFKSKVHSELGVNPDHITIVLDGKMDRSSGANASYLFKENTLNIFPDLFARDYTSIDIKSIMYHEYVHAKQFLIDGIVLPLDKDGYIVKSKYYIPITLEDVEEAWEDFYVILETNEISKNASERNVEEEQAYQFYRSITVDPMVHDYENGKVKTLEYNKDALRMELEAYSRQLRQYSLEMSNKCRNQMLESYYTTLESLNLIKNL